MTFRTVFRETPSSRQIALIDFPCTKNARRIFAIVSTMSIPISAPMNHGSHCGPSPPGSRLDADHPEKGVLIPRRFTTKINAKVMKQLKQSRNDLFASLDRPVLKGLPGERYQYAEWKRCTVAPDYHVEVDGHYYSVPFGLLRETVDARFTDVTIEVFHKGQRIAS